MRDRIHKLWCIIVYKNAKGVLILWQFFWGNVISKFATSVSKVTIEVPKISIVWLPRVKRLLLIWKMKTAWIKSSIHYIILQSGEGTQRNSSLPQSWLLIQKNQILKMTLLQINGSLENQNAFIKIIDLGVILLEKEFLTHLCTHLFDLVPYFFEMSDRRCCILTGPPCISIDYTVISSKFQL